MTEHTWASIEREQMSESFARQVIHGDRITLARVYLAAGSVVPRHSHENEQMTVLEAGRLRFVFDDHSREITAGQVMQIPGHVPHRVEALEESVALDVFSPVRDDWRRGDDAYLREG